MKINILFVIATIFGLTFVSCDFSTTLTISNNSSVSYTDVRWNGRGFTWTGYSGSVYYNTYDPGYNDTIDVNPGSGYIFFRIYNRYGNEPSGRTQEIVKIEKGENKTFVFDDSTIVIGTSIDSRPMTLLEFASQK